MQWSEQLYMDTVFPFRLQTASKICIISDSLLVKRRVCLLDDLTFGLAKTPQCKDNLNLILRTCQELGVSLSYVLSIKKIEGPSLRLTFLGIELNTQEMTTKLPEEKLQCIQTPIHTGSLLERQQERYALGELTYACKVVSPRKAKQRSRSDLMSWHT